jgi:hypothetical protein
MLMNSHEVKFYIYGRSRFHADNRCLAEVWTVTVEDDTSSQQSKEEQEACAERKKVRRQSLRENVE